MYERNGKICKKYNFFGVYTNLDISDAFKHLNKIIEVAFNCGEGVSSLLDRLWKINEKVYNQQH